MKKLSILFLGICLAACSKDDPMTISQSSVQLKYDGSYQFTVKKGGDNVSGATWKSSNTNVGTVDSKGNFKARKIGKTDVTASTGDGSVKASIEIQPYSTLYTEPVLDFNQSKATVKTKEKRKLLQESTDGLIYEGENSKIEFVFYLFENNRLDGGGVVFEATSPVVKEATTFLKERYPNSSLDGSLIIFLDDNKKYEIILGVDDTLGPVALYKGNTSSGRKALTPKQTESFRKALAAIRARK